MRSLEIYKPDNSTNVRLSRLFSKILPRQKDSLNSILISMRRNDAVKKYRTYEKKEDEKSYDKFNSSYNLYIETINEYIMNKIYKRVKYGIATEYEKTILSNYYYILKLKDHQYEEYKYRKQKYLLKLDYYNVEEEKIFDDYKNMYEEKVIDIYSELIKLCEENSEDKTYIHDISKIVDEYCCDVTLRELNAEYEIIKKYIYIKKKSKQNNIAYTIKKNELLLRITSKIFHDVVSKKTLRRMYMNLIKKANMWLNENIKADQFEEVYNLLLQIIKKYNPKDANPIELEKLYISKDANEYSELEKYINKKNKTKKKDTDSGKEEKKKTRKKTSEGTKTKSKTTKKAKKE